MESFIKKMGVKDASFKTLRNFGIDSYEKLVAFVPNKKKKSETKLAAELASKVFSRPERGIFCALNIRDLGETLQNRIVDFYGWENVKTPGFAFEGLPEGIGRVTLDKFVAALPENLKVVEMFAKDVRYSGGQAADVVKKPAPKGSVCFTGALSMPRGQASKMAESAGYEVKSSVTKGLTYLVTADPESGSSKNEKAKKYGTKVIGEADFLKLVDPNDGSVAEL